MKAIHDSAASKILAETPAGEVPLDYLMYRLKKRNVDLSRETGISQTAIGDYRAGRRPREGHAEKVAQAFGLTEADLWPEQAAA